MIFMGHPVDWHLTVTLQQVRVATKEEDQAILLPWLA